MRVCFLLPNSNATTRTSQVTYRVILTSCMQSTVHVLYSLGNIIVPRLLYTVQAQHYSINFHLRAEPGTQAYSA